ncbi:MAG: cation diffusion facilitator family transporter [Verrucomicrobiota bacterium]
MGHGHGHGTGGHSHSHSHSHGAEGVGDRPLFWAVAVNLGLSVAQFAAGLISGSTALLADALHNTNDAAALLIAYIARKVSRRGADAAFTFGYRRAELIGAMIQLTALIVVGLYLVVEAVRRFFAPEPLLGGWMMGAAALAIIVDVGTAWLLWAMSKGSLNVRAAFLHNLTDAAASVAVLLGGAAVFWLEWNWVDPLLTLGIAGYILFMSIGLLRRTSTILMEGTPAGISLREMTEAVEAVDGVEELHHLHVWELAEDRIALEAHLVVRDELAMDAAHDLRQSVKELLAERYAVAHSTLEVEPAARRCTPADQQC